ncbi:MAG: hypothetical protein NZ455_09390 [Bacteroidia bacterium]|nr:hypothetical protein [Bacteroidia bacterium]
MVDDLNFFWACPFAALRVGVLRAALTLRCYANAPHCLRTLRMPHAAAFRCFTLFLYILLFYLIEG